MEYDTIASVICILSMGYIYFVKLQEPDKLQEPVKIGCGCYYVPDIIPRPMGNNIEVDIEYSSAVIDK